MKKYKALPAVYFEIAGKSVTRSNWDRFYPSITEEDLDAIADSIFEKVANQPCSIHKKMPKILCKGSNLDNIEFYISSCCETYTDQIIEKIKDIKPAKKMEK